MRGEGGGEECQQSSLVHQGIGAVFLGIFQGGVELNTRAGGGGLWVNGLVRVENVGEVDISSSCLDGLFEVDDGNSVNGEGAFASVDDAVEDGFDAVGVGHLVTSGRGVDGESDDDESARDLGTCPDTTFREAKDLGV